MPFSWFWSFWHWNTESVREGALLRGPIEGIGSHWDEWFRHEATADERRAIAFVGSRAPEQRAFVRWLVRRWACEAQWGRRHPPARFVLRQLALHAPFRDWPALVDAAARRAAPSLSAIILGADGTGQPTDVRTVEVLLVPGSPRDAAPSVVAEQFRIDAAHLVQLRGVDAELDQVRAALRATLRGRGLARLLAGWLLVGERPLAAPVRALLRAGWAAMALVVLFLLVGPEPGRALVPLLALLVLAWGALLLAALATAVAVAAGALRTGRALAARLASDQAWIRMEGGLTVLGGSAGLAFCIDMLLALHRALPRAERRSWLWERVAGGTRGRYARWAATGALTADGRILPVVLEPKLRACARHGGIDDLITPARRIAGERVAAVARAAPRAAAAPVPHAAPRLGFAATMTTLRTHPSGHLATALLRMAGLGSRAQAATAALAVLVSLTMVAALPDVLQQLRQPRAPMPVGPVEAVMPVLGITFDAPQADAFSVRLQSEFWAHRHVPMLPAAEPGRSRVELQLRRLAAQSSTDVADGTLLVERRRHFLTREYAGGARVGTFSLAYFLEPNETP